MNEKTCKRMRRYIKSIGFNQAEPTLHQWQGGGTTPVTLPYTRKDPLTLAVHPQTFRRQYQKLKKMVKQNRLVGNRTLESV